ncbi:MAG: HlyD family efflux transporter periplasmic adaptor subunit [Vitreoscilla sp.]|nr:HlyD family efflux transporter periplasmic adaptor subunit [Vitreoscilla sp.]
MTLFRKESLHNQRRAWLGSIQLVQPVGLAWLTFWVLATLAVVSTFLFWGEYTRKAHLTGVLVPDRGLIRIAAPVAGTVLALNAREGQAVREGDPLFTLNVQSPMLAGPAQAELQQTFRSRLRSLDEAALQARALLLQRQTALGERLAALQREQAQLEAQAGLQAERLVLAEAALARLQALGGEKFVSAAQIQTKSEEVLGQRVEGAALARQRQALQREAATLAAERRELPLQADTALGEIERDRAEVAEAAVRAGTQSASRHLVVQAPADGVLSGLSASPGQAVTADAALASLSPTGGTLQAHLFAPSSALGFVQPAQPVWLRLAAFPYQKFGLQTGTVAQVAQAPLAPAELAVVPIAARPGSEPLYRVTVLLDRQAVSAAGQNRPLVAGMQLEADVMLERRRLVEWLFEPVIGWAQRP